MADSSRDLLDAAYSRLGFVDGGLLSAATEPGDTTQSEWVNKGDWLALAKRVGAERVFFVNDYPVIVFVQQTTNDPTEWMKHFNSVWCMARPQILFLAREGEMQVFNLTKRPAREGEQPTQYNRLLDTVRATADVHDTLYKYRREQVESGRLFEDHRFGFDDRADRALIRDLGRVRRALIKAELPVGYAHALIGRSIFIRYLEDRRVLTEEYFRKVARANPVSWNPILDEAREAAVDFGSGQPIFYPFILSNKAFTYALFTQLAKEFNGDMFPVDPHEQRAVTEQHLSVLHRFLLGGKEERLFFFAYRFDIIPIELISSIYEKFYSLETKKRRDEGSYYTPSALVDFVLAETLTEDILDRMPRVMDPACGSGIFLVEAFRRIVRHRIQREGRMLTSQELRDILKTQIAGIDISAEAIRVAAFSLYLAMLHYLDPPDILQHRRLPCLTYGSRTKTNAQFHYDILIAEDAFRIEETVSTKAVRQRFLSQCADVVVGNPPWGSPQMNVPENIRSDGGIGWCATREFSVGDKERSQTFIHRAIDILKPGGRAGLLVSTGVLLKRHQKTKFFRQQWLSRVSLRKVVNFAAVRDAYFRNGGDDGEADSKGAIAPFAAVFFDSELPADENFFAYWSAKESAFVKRVQAVVLNAADLHVGRQVDFLYDDTLWKTYWWGGHRDRSIVQRLRVEKTFGKLLDADDDNFRIGFLEAKKNKKPSGWLLKYPEFPTDLFDRYGVLPKDNFKKPPKHVKRRCTEDLYDGSRLLIKRGVGSDEFGKGRIIARYETESFSFRHSIYCMVLKELDDAKAKIVLAIIWSSLTRYFLFMTSGTWGSWHDEVLKETLTEIPIRFPSDKASIKKLVKSVDLLRELPPETPSGQLFALDGMLKKSRDKKIRELEAQLNNDVFDLFGLAQEERERIDEFCTLDLDFFYRGIKSRAVLPLDWPDGQPKFGRRKELRRTSIAESELGKYVGTFLDLWEPQLEDQGGVLRWRIIRPAEVSSMIAVIFETEPKGKELPPPKTSDEQEWTELLGRLSQSTRQHANANRLFVDGLVRIVTDSEIAIIKRNERRLWTTTWARDDAEATLLMAMQSEGVD